MKKMNNKGFSLVELIIVIAIMAILAGALAPALLRYIEKTRVSNDKSTASNLKTAVETALANEEVMDEITASADYVITTTSTGGADLTTLPTKLQAEVQQTLAASKLKIKSKKDLQQVFIVSIKIGGAGEADIVEVYLKTSGNQYLDTQGVEAAQTQNGQTP